MGSDADSPTSYPQGQGFLPTSPRPSRVSCCRCGHLARIHRFRLALELLPSAMRGTCPRELRPLQPGTQDRASSSSAEPNRAPPDLEPRARSQYYCKSVRCQGLSVSHSECRVMRTQHLSHPAGTSMKRSCPNSELPAPPSLREFWEQCTVGPRQSCNRVQVYPWDVLCLGALHPTLYQRLCPP